VRPAPDRPRLTGGQPVEISRAKLNLQPVDLGAEAATIAAELQRQDPDRRVRFTIQQPPRALADADLIREVLHNLLDNASKFTSGRDDATPPIQTFTVDFIAGEQHQANVWNTSNPRW
jgi:signal transduction histidine kinase